MGLRLIRRRQLGLVTFRILQLGEVPPSTLYWAVQAVDNSFEGGPWSAGRRSPEAGALAGIRVHHRADEILVDISGKAQDPGPDSSSRPI